MEKDDAKRLAEQGWYFRHACKVFDTEKVISEEDFSYILNAARFSPSSFGLEPWRFVVLQNMELRDGLIPYCWGARRQLPTCSHFVIILARKDSMAYNSDYIKRTMTEMQRLSGDVLTTRLASYKNFQENDFKLFENKRAMFDWSCKQGYIALAMMIYSAAMVGIDSCPIEGFDREKVEQYLTDHEIIDQSEFGVACMVSFGYRFAEGRAKTRYKLAETVKWVY